MKKVNAGLRMKRKFSDGNKRRRERERERRKFELKEEERDSMESRRKKGES